MLLRSLLILVLFLSQNYLQAQSLDTDAPSSKYRVVAFEKNNSENASVSNSVEVINSYNFYLPNAFTPNSDGINDVFTAKGTGIKEYHLMIFNRWGEMIFESQDMERGWDGSYEGELVSSDSYVYKVKVKGSGNEYNYKSGTVTVIR